MELFGFGKTVTVNLDWEIGLVTISIYKEEKKYGVLRVVVGKGDIQSDNYWKIVDMIDKLKKQHIEDSISLFWNSLQTELDSQFKVDLLKNGKVVIKTSVKNEIKQPAIKDEQPEQTYNKAIAKTGHVYYSNGVATVTFDTKTGKVALKFKHRKAWSHRKYINEALQKLELTPSWEFTYGWEIA